MAPPAVEGPSPTLPDTRALERIRAPVIFASRATHGGNTRRATFRTTSTRRAELPAKQRRSYTSENQRE